MSFSFTVGICTNSIKYCYTISYDKVEWQQLEVVFKEFLVTVNVIGTGHEVRMDQGRRVKKIIEKSEGSTKKREDLH